MTPAQIANSNIVALSATLIVRLMVGPAVDRFGPRKVMAALLVAGAIPSGLAGLAKSAQGIYVVRFFIGILGGTFVPCLAWTSAFFDKNIVGTANAFVGGWGNLGGGATYAIMVSLYSTLHKHMSSHKAWRVAFAVVPVPVLLLVAALTFIFGTDHPAGKWSQRHQLPASHLAAIQGHQPVLDNSELATKQEDKEAGATATVQAVPSTDNVVPTTAVVPVDVAVNEPLTFKSAMAILTNPLTWLPALAYMTTFGFELAVDSVLATVILHPHPELGQLDAGYLASIFGLMNIWTRPLGGFIADILYAKYGIKWKKYWTIACGVLQGLFCLGFGLLLERETKPDLGVMMGLVVLMAVFNEMGNGANFSLVPHCNVYNNGVMSGLVGAFGNVGGIFYALIFRFRPAQGVAWTISGIFALVVNVILLAFPSPNN